jgi:flagellar assembly factor FliW
VPLVRVVTERFGELDVEDDRVLDFPDGLPGFSEATRFALVPVTGNEAFFWLQSVDDPALAFLSAIPWPFFPDYEPEVPDADQEALGLTTPDDVLVLCLLTIRREERQVTANLMGPLVVNQLTRTGRQIVLADSDYPLQAPLTAA